MAETTPVRASATTTALGRVRPIQVMISSRIDDKVGDRTLRSVRAEIADRLQSIQINEQPAFDVWRSEVAGAEAETEGSWDACMDHATRALIVLVIYNGKAGWPREGLGICHAEYQHAVNDDRAKVRIVEYTGPEWHATQDEWNRVGATTADTRFFAELQQVNALHGRATSPAEIVEFGYAAIWQAVSDQVARARRAGVQGEQYLGEGLDWLGQPFAQRAATMRAALIDALSDPSDLKPGDGKPAIIEVGDQRLVVRTIAGRRIGIRCSAVPGSFADPTARSALGQLFGTELDLVDAFGEKDFIGPLELVVVQGGVTATQIRRYVNRPDALVAAPRFGVFVSDDWVFGQAFFLKNAVNGGAIRNAVGSAFEWLEQSGQADLVARRAEARLAILRAHQAAAVQPGAPR